jgi:hypothetical protein
MFIGPTPSWARAALIDESQSPLLGAMLPGGLDGGRIPAAPAGTAAANVLAIMIPIGNKSAANRH